jgi:hypothetical protein
MFELSSNNLVIQFKGKKYIVDATVNDVYKNPMPILIRPYPGERTFL